MYRSVVSFSSTGSTIVTDLGSLLVELDTPLHHNVGEPSYPVNLQQNGSLLMIQQLDLQSAMSKYPTFEAQISYSPGDVVLVKSDDNRHCKLGLCLNDYTATNATAKFGICSSSVFNAKFYHGKGDIAEHLSSLYASLAAASSNILASSLIHDTEHYSETPDTESIMLMQDGEEFYEKCYNIVQDLKSLGNTHLKTGNANLAALKYSKSMSYLFSGMPGPELNENYYGKFTETRYLLSLNLALAFIKVASQLLSSSRDSSEKDSENDSQRAAQKSLSAQNLRDAQNLLEKSTASATLCMENPHVTPKIKAKCLYRRASAYLLLKQEDKAIADLEQALVVAPGDVAIENELNKARAARQRRLQSQKSTYSKFFS